MLQDRQGMKEVIPGLVLDCTGDNPWQEAQTTLKHSECNIMKSKSTGAGTRPFSAI